MGHLASAKTPCVPSKDRGQVGKGTAREGNRRVILFASRLLRLGLPPGRPNPAMEHLREKGSLKRTVKKS